MVLEINIHPATGELSNEAPTPKDWESVCEVGRQAAESIDTGRWTIGELAQKISKVYGDDLVGRFAREINVGKRRVYQYGAVYGFYEICTPVQFLADHPTLTYSHMREAIRMWDKSKETPEQGLQKALEMLDEAAANTYTIDEMSKVITQRLGKPTGPKKLAECDVIIIGLMESEPCTLKIEIPLDELTSFEDLKDKSVHLVIRELSA